MALIGLVLAASSASALGNGQSAPSFQLESITSDETFSLEEDIMGSPSVLVFWTTWCPHCQRELPNMNRLAGEYQKQGVVFLGINAGLNDSRSRAASYLEQNNIDEFPMVYDNGSTVSREFGVPGFPTFIVLDADGTIRHQDFAFSQELLAKLDSLAGGE